ncbi:MAG: SAM-dependent chlorinase/fluorinase [bacterium]|nr:SAM-dependent chlorinase/fluorinase [bacterium]
MAIVLLSDFGWSDGYVGMMKGVIHHIAPDAPILDLAHDLPPFQITQAAWVLRHALPYFPEGSIFVCVVDPGVGSERSPILVKTEHFTFIGPDNGIFTLALEQEPALSYFKLTNPRFFQKSVSATFHGRDIFAPVAAHFYTGVELGNLGEALPDILRLPELFPQKGKGFWEGQIMAIDRFGNAITNFHRDFLGREMTGAPMELKLVGQRRKPLDRWVTHYAEGKNGETLLLFGASGYLEIAEREGSAAQKLKLKIGQRIQLRQVS